MWRRVLVAGAAGVVLAGALIAPAAVAAPGDRIGTGKQTCLPGPGANCRDVSHKWMFQHHGDLSGAKFARAKLHGADLKGVNLTNANLRGVILRHADLRGAKLRGADFSRAAQRTGIARATPTCTPNCQGADLSGANLSGANLTNANLYGANLTDASLSDAVFCDTNMPDGSINNSGCQ